MRCHLPFSYPVCVFPLLYKRTAPNKRYAAYSAVFIGLFPYPLPALIRLQGINSSYITGGIVHECYPLCY
ncbi:hypothetical protein D3C79_899080 [compost metagenome]